jgi:hypothetical protein
MTAMLTGALQVTDTESEQTQTDRQRRQQRQSSVSAGRARRTKRADHHSRNALRAGRHSLLVIAALATQRQRLGAACVSHSALPCFFFLLSLASLTLGHLDGDLRIKQLLIVTHGEGGGWWEGRRQQWRASRKKRKNKQTERKENLAQPNGPKQDEFQMSLLQVKMN